MSAFAPGVLRLRRGRSWSTTATCGPEPVRESFERYMLNGVRTRLRHAVDDDVRGLVQFHRDDRYGAWGGARSSGTAPTCHVPQRPAVRRPRVGPRRRVRRPPSSIRSSPASSITLIHARLPQSLAARPPASCTATSAVPRRTFRPLATASVCGGIRATRRAGGGADGTAPATVTQPVPCRTFRYRGRRQSCGTAIRPRRRGRGTPPVRRVDGGASQGGGFKRLAVIQRAAEWAPPATSPSRCPSDFRHRPASECLR